ncbi:LysR family transcriptional regulator [Allorhizobium sp. BGMRC 0089]|uniref:LysR family transcriptional regulator n=1 Tax=Allorhizobium sonneratiae TaxID=2934936 RepID=UPI0020332A79|nr:LysR family transcriptional regulator [Allorhizobium sonneratiae]MCM2291601.1 LysR family transcriptional regulator [Allorhizobium sonneratiae]
MIELRHLRYAIAVAETGHMTRAAEKLGLQQPPLSQQIRNLEEMVGTPLFHRLPRGMALTEAGEAFLVRARQIIADVDQAVDAARRAARGETGLLAIGFTSSAAFHPLVARVVRALRQSAPDLGLRLEEGSTDELQEALVTGRLDAVFIRFASERLAGFHVEALTSEPMVLALPDTHVLAHSKPSSIDLADLAQETFILYRRLSAQGLYDRIIAACQKAGFSPKVEQETPKIVSTLSLVAAGLGVSIIPRSMARLETSGVAYCDFHQGSNIEAPLYLACRKPSASGALRNFVAEVRRQAEHDEDGQDRDGMQV